MAKGDDTVFTIRLKVPAGINAVHTLRAVLKRLWRDHGLRCINIGEDDLKLGQVKDLRRHMVRQRVCSLADLRLEAFTTPDGMFYGDRETGELRREAIAAFEDDDLELAQILCEEAEAAILARGEAFRRGLAGSPPSTGNH